MKLAILTSGFLPVPASKGGAVENLIVNMINQNEKEKKIEITLFSIYDKDAMEEAKKYKKTKVIFIKTNPICKVLDKIIYWLAKNIFRKNNLHSYRFIIQRLDFLNKISKRLKKDNYDKILLENHPTQYLALKWRRNYKKYEDKYYYHCHNEFSGEYGCHKIILKTKKIICVSNYIKESLCKYLNMDKEKFEVLRNCIDKNIFKNNILKEERDIIRKKLEIKKDEIVFVFTGRIVKEKGVLELIKATRLVNKNNFKVLIIGASLNAINNKSKYEEVVQKNLIGIEKKVIFTGYIDYADIYKFYNISDVAIVPSIWNDPAPLSVIEALCCGLPIITTKSGGILEYANEKCAILLDRDEKIVNNIAQAMKELIDNKEARKKMSAESIAISDDLTVENYYKNISYILGI